MSTEEKLDEILEWLKDLNDKVDRYVGNTTNGYTDRQLYDMKKVMKWDDLAAATGITRSTCFYRVKQYKELIGEVDKKEKTNKSEKPEEKED